MTPIAIFYHGLISHGDPRTVRPVALSIIDEAMRYLMTYGLLDAASELHTCFNGAQSEEQWAKQLVPGKARIVMHGPHSFAENLTLVELERWLKDHPNWHVLYFHAKGATHDLVSPYALKVQGWRNCMLLHLVQNWRQCVQDLDTGYEAVGCHWMTGLADGTQNIFAGNFWWATSNYLRTLPSIFERERIKISGIADKESRFEAEVWIGNGKRLPRVRDYHPGAPCG
jgi:hypothetical protein